MKESKPKNRGLFGKFNKPKNSPRPKGEFSSIREYCFDAFSRGVKPYQLLKEDLSLKENTVLCYYAQWKALPSPTQAEPIGPYLSDKMLRRPEDRRRWIKSLADKFGLPEKEVEECFLKPHAIRGFATGKTLSRLKLMKKLKDLDKALEFMEMCTERGLPPDEVFSVLNLLLFSVTYQGPGTIPVRRMVRDAIRRWNNIYRGKRERAEGGTAAIFARLLDEERARSESGQGGAGIEGSEVTSDPYVL